MLKFLFLFVGFSLLTLNVKAWQGLDAGKATARENAARYYAKATENGLSEAKSLLYADSLAQVAMILNDPAVWVNTYKLKGDIALGKHDYEQSVYWFKNAMRQARKQQDTLALVRVMHNLGLSYYHVAKFDKALESLTQTLVLGRKHLSKYQQAIVMDHLGLVYSELGDYDEALAYFNKSLERLEKKELKGKAMVFTNMGILYRKQEQKDKALEYLRQARKYYEEVGEEEGIARVLNELALVYMRENPDISVEYLSLAKKLYVNNNNKAGLFYLNKYAGQAYASLEDYEHARLHFQMALNYADTLQNKYLKGDVFLKLASLYELQDNYVEAAKYYKKYINDEKDFYSQELVNNLASARESYEIGQKEGLIRDLEEKASLVSNQLRFRNLSLILVFVLALLTMLLLIFFVLKFRNAAKTNKLLQARHRLILSQKEELSKQRDLIDQKNMELNKAQAKIKEYNLELLAGKGELEQKVKARTKELEDTYRKLSFHINNTPLAVLEWNNKKELIHWPAQAEGIFGYTADEMLGLRIDEVPFLLPEDRKEMKDTIAQLSSGELARQYFTRLNIDRYGNRKYVEWSYSVLLNPEGDLESVLTIANDVSLREQAYRALKATNQELDTFLYKSSHDLRGPIARMQGIINLGLLETEDGAARTYFNMLNRVTEEFNTLLLRLHMVHNINQHEFMAEDIMFHGFVEGIIKEYDAKSLSFNPVNIVNKVPQGMLLKADTGLLTIALINLLENSLLFADNFNPYVEFDAIYLPSGKYIITVADNGLGIPLHYQEKIFDMFFQGSTRSTGTGLGLYMVRKAIKRLGGDIRLLSENGHTVFEITLPAAKTHEFADAQLVN